jgi:signal peptidase I
VRARFPTWAVVALAALAVGALSITVTLAASDADNWPGWLQPYHRWGWWSVLGLLAAAVALAVWQATRQPPTEGGHPADAPADARTDSKAPRQPQTLRSVVRETAVLVVLAILLAVLFKTFLVQAFYIPSGSMEPTLNVSDRVLVEKVSYRFGDVKDGDVIVFVHDLPWVEPESGNPIARFFSGLGQAVGVAPPSSRDFIKRVVGTPGDYISCQQGKLYRNGQPVSEPYLAAGTTTKNCTSVTVPPGKLYVMGDNRNNSEDSRRFGPIDRSSVVGRAFVRIWPLSHTGWLRRDR